MPDFKFWGEKWAERYCNAPDYRGKGSDCTERDGCPKMQASNDWIKGRALECYFVSDYRR